MKKLVFLFCLLLAVALLVSCDGPATRGPKVGSKEAMTAVAMTSDSDTFTELKLGSKFRVKSFTSTEKPNQTSTVVFEQDRSPKSITLTVPILSDFNPNKLVLLGIMQDGSKVYTVIIRNTKTWITFSRKKNDNTSFMGEIIIDKVKEIKCSITKLSGKYSIVEDNLI
jgi:hypothetical protein